MSRTFAVAGICGAALALGGVPAEAATGVDTSCQLGAAETFSAPVALSAPTPVTFTWQGGLSGCQGSGAAAGASVTVGEAVTIDGVAYRAPAPGQATASCVANSSRSGSAIIQWQGGGLTVVSLNGPGTGLAAGIIGSVADSIRLTRVQPDASGNKVVDTVPTTVYKGDSVVGSVVASATDVPSCATGLGSDALTGALTFYHG